MSLNFRYEIVVVDKALAESLLGDTTEVTRRLRGKGAAMRNLATIMRNGEWALNGDAIILDHQGKVVGGKKRLLAAINHDACFPTLIIWGVDPEAAKTLDQQKLRTFTATLQAAGLGKDAGSTASSTAAVANIAKHGTTHTFTLKSVGGMNLLKDHPELVEDMKASKALVSVRRVLGPTMTAGFFHLTRKVNPEKSEMFFKRLDLLLGQMADDMVARSRVSRKWHSSSGDPILALVHQLEVLERSFYKPNGKRVAPKSKERYRQSSLFIQAWNAFESGIPLTSFSDRGGILINGIDPAEYQKYDSSVDRELDQDQVRAAYQAAVDESQITASVEVVTPKMAQEWLDRNGPLPGGKFSQNRKLSMPTAQKYAQDIADGDFRFNGESIKILRNDHLGDGQHRCTAVVIAQKPLISVVVRGVENSAFETLDQSRPSSFQNLFKEETEHPAAAIAAGAILHLWRYCHVGITNSFVPSNNALLRFSEGLPDILEAAQDFKKLKLSNIDKLNKMLKRSIVTALHTIFGKMDVAKADLFFRNLGNGVLVEDNSALDALRNHLMNSDLSEKEVITALCQGWVDMIHGATYENGKWRVSEKLPAPFDKPAGPEIVFDVPALGSGGLRQRARSGYRKLEHPDLFSQ